MIIYSPLLHYIAPIVVVVIIIITVIIISRYLREANS